MPADDAFDDDVKAMLDRHAADLVELQRRYPKDTGEIIRCELAFVLGQMGPGTDVHSLVASVLDQLASEAKAGV